VKELENAISNEYLRRQKKASLQNVEYKFEI
jgi:hypothetical protein